MYFTVLCIILINNFVLQEMMVSETGKPNKGVGFEYEVMITLYPIRHDFLDVL